MHATTAQAAYLTDIPAGTIRRWGSEGKLTRYGTPGRAQWDIDEINQLIDLLRSPVNAILPSVGDLSPKQHRTRTPQPSGERGSNMNGAKHGAR